jgi:hypothetical protein
VDIPVFDFNNPWVALIQLALAYLLPLLTGLVSDKLAKPVFKIAALGVLNIIGAALTWLLDVAIASAWDTLDGTALINVIVNAALTFFLAQGVYQGIIKPTGQAAAVANAGVSLIPADPQRELEAAQAHADEARETLARRISTAEAVATRVATAVVEEKLAAAKKPRASTAKPATKPLTSNTTKASTKTATK